MELHLNPEQESRLLQLAVHSGKDAEQLVTEAALRLLDEDAFFRAAVQKGIEQADRGEFLSDEEMEARLQEMLHS